MIFFVGTLPPPTHGMSLVNQAVCRELRAAGVDVEELNTAPSSLSRDFLARSSRWTLILRAWARLLKSGKPGDRLYLSISGGWGQLYDLVSVILARSKGMRCIVHHHNFAYLDEFHKLTRIVLQAAGADAINVALCSHMAHRLQAGYGVHRTAILSNIAFLPDAADQVGTKKPHTIGFLSNLTREKGAETLLALAWAIKEKSLPFSVIVAGPCHDAELCQDLQEAQANGVLEWRGGVFGESKSAFWNDIDILVFPSRSEAEPLVVFESLMIGVPLISYMRGCIPEQLGNAGVMVDPSGDFVQAALQALQHWRSDPAAYDRCRRESIEQYRAAKRASRQQWQDFLVILSEMEPEKRRQPQIS